MKPCVLCCCYVKAVLALVGAWVLLRKFLGCLLPRLHARSGRFVERFGKWAIVTGSTDGIGLALCHELAKEGLNLLLVSRNEERLKQAAESLAKSNVEVECFAFDFSSEAWDSKKLAALQTRISALGEDLGMLVNNVGKSYDHPMEFEELDAATVDDLLFVNVRSAFLMTHAALPVMKRNRRGAVIFTGSGASVIPANPLLACYAGCKAAIAAFADSLRVECREANVLVQCHTPLFVVSKLSKVKRPSLFVRSAEDYARDAVAAIKGGNVSPYGSACVVPSAAHRVQLCGSWLAPSNLFYKMMLRSQHERRARALAKKTR